MIKYALQCEDAHRFEIWFTDSTAYEDQRQKGLVTCPTCGSANVEKALMTPSVTGTKKSTPKPTRLAANAQVRKEVVTALRKIRKQVTENADDVGERFAEEARKIHYEEVEPRGIYGQATAEDARELTDEGVEFHPLPLLPEEHN